MAVDLSGNRNLAWALIILGGVFQIGWSIGLDYSEGMTNLLWDVVVLVSLLLSMLCLSIPMKSGIPMGAAYAVWIGIGVILTIVASAILGLEEINAGMVFFMLVTVAGVVGLKAVSDKGSSRSRARGGVSRGGYPHPNLGDPPRQMLLPYVHGRGPVLDGDLDLARAGEAGLFGYVRYAVLPRLLDPAVEVLVVEAPHPREHDARGGCQGAAHYCLHQYVHALLHAPAYCSHSVAHVVVVGDDEPRPQPRCHRGKHVVGRPPDPYNREVQLEADAVVPPASPGDGVLQHPEPEPLEVGLARVLVDGLADNLGADPLRNQLLHHGHERLELHP
ncbi:MAG: multidrug efflux SMR transporter [Thermoplasmata archaeon]|nr:multidrug efflux SMR transporter [Thermoplasmata archaeon]